MTHFSIEARHSDVVQGTIGSYRIWMLVDFYIEALLVDPEQADSVWELWNAGLLSDQIAAFAWLILVINHS